ncbi:ALQxL family class IV lanthipeptide [Sphaerisporangium sp. NPDC051011]
MEIDLNALQLLPVEEPVELKPCLPLSTCLYTCTPKVTAG